MMSSRVSLPSASPVAPQSLPEVRPRKYTLCFTQRCNLACSYCYIRKSEAVMSIETAERTVDFIFRHAQGAGGIEIGFFGGEPLVNLNRMRALTDLNGHHPQYDRGRVRLKGAFNTVSRCAAGGRTMFKRRRSRKITSRPRRH